MTLQETAIDFEEENHTYKLRGFRLMSVTQIMKPMSLMAYDGVPMSTMDFAANRGTRAHESISNMILYGIEETDEDTVPYVDAFKDFCAAYQPKWAASEYRTYHKQLLYAGTIDLIADNGDGTVDVMDIKTTSAFHSAMLSAQLGAYAAALKSHGIKVRDLYGLQLLPTGKYRFEKVADGYSLFLCCRVITSAMNKEK